MYLILLIFVIFPFGLMYLINSMWNSTREMEECLYNNTEFKFDGNLNIQIVGSAGCGKSTLGRFLANVYNIEYLRFDDYKTKYKDWKKKDRIEFEKEIKSKLSIKNEWILDGNYHKLINQELTKSFNIKIYLDYNFFVVICRLVKRSLMNFQWSPIFLIYFPFAPIIIFILLINQYFINLSRRKQYYYDISQLSSNKDSPLVILFKTPRECELYIEKILSTYA
jgi:adenylate kinase family enzyme